MIFKFKFLIATFIATFIFTSNEVSAMRNQQMDGAFINITRMGSYKKLSSIFKNSVVNYCGCHKATERIIVGTKDNNPSLSLTDDQLQQDIDQINTLCRSYVMSSFEGSKVAGVQEAFEQRTLDEAFGIWENALNERLNAANESVSLDNTQINVKVICNDQEMVPPEIEEELAQTTNRATHQECLTETDEERRTDCTVQIRTPNQGAVDRTVPGNDFIPNPLDVVTRIVGETNPIDALILEQMNQERENLQQKIQDHCQCQAVQTRAQVLACIDIVNQNYSNGEETDGLAQWKGTLVCDAAQSAEFRSDQFLLNCIEGPEPSKCKERLETRLGMLYCFNSEVQTGQCIEGLKNLVLDYNHRKIVDPCRDEVRPQNAGDRNNCEEIAAAQFLLNNHSVNFFQALCPIDWSGCDKEGDDKRCRPQIFGEYECKNNLVRQMLNYDEELFNENAMVGFNRGLNKARIMKKLEGQIEGEDVTTPSRTAENYKTDKSNDAALLQMFAVENNMNHIDMDIITGCQRQTLNEENAETYNASDHLAKTIDCYYGNNIYIADEELMAQVKDKYCTPERYTSEMCPIGWEKEGVEAYQCEKQCMNRLISRTFSEVDPECLTKTTPMQQKLCSIEKNLTILAENSFPVTSCFNEQKFPNRLDRRNCQDVAKKLDEEVQACLQDNEFPLQCIDELMKKTQPIAYHENCTDEQQQAGECFSILNEYINSMLAWNNIEATQEQCSQMGYFNNSGSNTGEETDDRRGQLECEMMVLAQDEYSNSNSFIDRQFYCQTNETRSTGGTVECNDFSTVYVAQSSVSGLSAIGDGDLQNLTPPGPPGPIARTTGGNGSTGGSGGGRGSSSGANGAIPFAAVAGGSGLSYDDSPVVNVNGNEVGLNSSLLSGAKGNGFFGFLKDFKYVKFRHHPEEPCKALGKAALTRVIGTVAAGVTVYLVHKNVMENYKKEKEQEPNDGSDPNNRAVHNTKNVQIKAMDHISQGYKGAIAGMGVKIGMNLIANSITRKAIANEQARMSSLRAQGLPATPTVCNSSDIPSRSERRANRRLNTMNEFILPSEKKPELFVSYIERAQSEAELRIIFDEYTEFSTGYKVASLTEEEYRQKEFEYMLESVSTTETEQETVGILKSTFKTLITTTSEIIFPSANAFIGGGGGGSIMTLMPLIMPIIANMGKKDESGSRNNGSSTGSGGSGGGNSCDTITREDVIAFRTGTTNPSASNCQPSPDDNEITGDGDSVDVITGANEILANDTTSQDCGVLNDQSLQLAATRKARCDFGGDDCGAITVERSPAAGACGGQPEPATSGES